MCQQKLEVFVMKVVCNWKNSLIEGYDSQIVCRLRFPFKEKLSDNDKNEVISSLYKSRNVPKRFEDIHEAIKSLKFSVGEYSLKDVVLTQKRDAFFVDVIIKFGSFKRFNRFLSENQLVAEPF